MNKFTRVVVICSPKSTLFDKYNKEIKPIIAHFADKNGAELVEIPLVFVPYFTARELIGKSLADGDLVVAAGGDGVANVALDAAMMSGHDTTFAVVPLGNVNDFASSIYGRVRDPARILHGTTLDFYPLDLSINGEHKLFASQYISFGATTVLVDWLNSPAVRAARKKYRGNVARLMLFGARNIGKISRAIAAMKLPDRVDNSFGFFLGRTGKYFKLRASRELHHKPDKLIFHRDNFRGKVVLDAQKLTMWLLAGIPGKVSTCEKIELSAPCDMICQVGGDNVPLENVREIACRRAKKPLKILVPTK